MRWTFNIFLHPVAQRSTRLYLKPDDPAATSSQASVHVTRVSCNSILLRLDVLILRLNLNGNNVELKQPRHSTYCLKAGRYV